MKKLHTFFLIVILFIVFPSFAIESNGTIKNKKILVADPPCETYIYGPTSACINDITLSLSCYVNLDCNANWSVISGSGTLYVTGGGATASYTLSPADAGTTVKIIVNNDALYCTASGGVITAELDIVITALPGTPGLVTGSGTVCQGQNGVVYSVPSISAATGYVWSVPTGASISSGGTTNTITVNFSGSATSGNVTVYGTNGCGNGSVSSAFPVIVNPLPGAAGAISGSNSVCQGQNSVSYSVASISNATGYSWTLPGGATIVSGNNTNGITVNYSGSASGGSIGVTGVNACGNGTTSTLPISVNPLPIAAGSITGTTSLCAGTSSVSYSVPSITNATGYTWVLPGGASIASGSNTNTITVNYSGSATSGDVSVMGTNSCGNGASSTIAVNVNPFPVAGGSVSGIAAICQGQNGVTYSIPSITYASGYSWSLPSGASIVSGNNTNSITVDYSNSASSGNITVYGTNSCGNGSASVGLPITVNPLPSASGAVSGTASVCKGQNSVAYSVAAITNATGYSWSLPTGATIVSGNNTNSITVDYSASASSGNITVYATNGCGNGTTSAAFAVTVNSLPSVTASASATTVCAGNPVILTGGNANFYAWTGGVTNGIPFNPSSTITYTVTGTDGNGCSNTATQTINVITPGIPSICMVTVDDASNYNIVYWDKSSFVNTSADSFIVYRETTSNVYKRIGAVSIDSMSSFTDTVRALYFPFTGDPNVGTYRYKLQLRDTCGNLGAMSLFHNTIYANQTAGTFNWNHYQIEGQTTPLPQLSAYLLERDNNNTGTWAVIGGVAGSQTSVTDPSYVSYPNGRWRISTSWSINCDPTRASINTTRSNIKHTAIATGLTSEELNGSVLLYPNPANDIITIELSEQIQKATIKITNAIGQTVYEETIISTASSKTLKNIMINNYAKGVYTVSIENNGIKTNKKLIVN